MTTLKILICGGGCAGLAIALLLSRAGHHVVVVERHPSLRASGAQVDIDSEAVEIARRMGILDKIREKMVVEDGVTFVDENGKIQGTIMSGSADKGIQSTTKYEIMRGDLIQILYDATKGDAEYVFGTTVEKFDQDDDQVTAYFSDGTSDTYDLLIGADGQNSRIRRAILPEGSPDPYRRLGSDRYYLAYWLVPRVATDDATKCTVYHSTKGRMIMRRSHNSDTQVYLNLRDNSPELGSIGRAPIEQQKEFWVRKFQDAGWDTGRFLNGLQTADDFYCQEVVQIVTRQWFKGRVVLIGDAAHCSSPFGGQGTTGSFVGAYILAEEILHGPNDLLRAFANYDRNFRPYTVQLQNVHPWLLRLGFPATLCGVVAFRWVIWFICLLRLPDVIDWFSRKTSTRYSRSIISARLDNRCHSFHKGDGR